MRAILSTIVSLLLLSAIQAQALFGNDKRPYVLMPAEAISSGVVVEVNMSMNGHLVLYRKAPFPLLLETLEVDPTKSELYIYSRRTKSSRFLNLPLGATNIRMFGNDRHLYFSTPRSTHNFFDLDTGLARQIEVKNVDLHYFGHIDSSPFLMGVSTSKDIVLYFVDGSVRSVKIPQGLTIADPIESSEQTYDFLATRRNGKQTEFYRISLNRSTNAVNQVMLSSDDLDSILKMNDIEAFSLDQSGDDAYVSLESDDEESRPTIGPTSISGKEEKSTHTYINSKAKVGPSEGFTLVSDRGSCIVYQDAGCLLIREIKAIDPALGRKLAIQSLKDKLVKRVKQVGIGFLIFAVDNDDVLPGAEGWENKVMPYLKNRDLMNDFNYTFKGGDMRKVENESSVELGFILGPGGRAVVYLDGSARWIPNP